MLSQPFKPLRGTSEPETVLLIGRFAIGATGAVGTKTGGQGLSLTRTDVGSYTLQLKGSNNVSAGVPAILHASCSVFNSDTDPSDDTDAHFVKMLAISSSAGTVTIQCVDEAGAVKELPSGGSISFLVAVKLSSATR